MNSPSSPAVLFVKTSSLGDVVHHLPAVSDVRRRFPDAHLAWVVEEAYAPIARLHRGIDDVIAVATRRWRKQVLTPQTWNEVLAFGSRLRAKRYDTIIDTQGLIRSALIARLARGEHHGFDRGEVRERLAATMYDVTHIIGRDHHAVARNRLLTGAALGYTPEEPIDYGLTPAAAASDRPYAVFLHATARAEKEWPEASWIALAREAMGRGLEVVLPWATTRERERAERLAAATGARVPPLRPLDEVARLIGGAALVVGVDTGLLHLAAALGVPLLAIFVATRPQRTGPAGQGSITLVDGNGNAPALADVVAALDRTVLERKR